MKMSEPNYVFHGKYYHSISFEEFEAECEGFVAVFDGKVSIFDNPQILWIFFDLFC